MVKKSTNNIFIGFFLLIGTVWLLPIIFQILTSFKSLEETYAKTQTIFPKMWTLDAFRDAFSLIPLSRYYLNSFIVASFVVIAVLITSSLAAYSFAKHDFPGRNILFILFLCTMMVPFQVLIIPLYLFITKIHIQNTYFALILPFMGSAFGVFLLRQFMSSVPDDLIDAARIDGLNEFSIYVKIVMPLSMAALATLAIFTFLWNWDSFLWPLIATNSERLRTIPVGMVFFQQTAGGFTIKYPHVMAVSILAMFPSTIVFLFLQRYFVKAITITGIK